MPDRDLAILRSGIGVANLYAPSAGFTFDAQGLATGNLRDRLLERLEGIRRTYAAPQGRINAPDAVGQADLEVSTLAIESLLGLPQELFSAPAFWGLPRQALGSATLAKTGGWVAASLNRDAQAITAPAQAPALAVAGIAAALAAWWWLK